MKTVNIEFMKNSGFHLVFDKIQMVLDYYEGPLTLTDQPGWFITTHGHPDHYNPKIFEHRREDINYILSDDIIPPEGEEALLVRAGQIVDLGDVKLNTYDSTDLGISMIIGVENWNILHMGDLNWWHWEEDSKEEQEAMEKAFKDEVKKMSGIPIDIAMVPVDPRMGEAGFWAGDYVIRWLRPRYVIPMHLQENWEFAEEFKERHNTDFTLILPVVDEEASWIIMDNE
ncbi:MAG: MBL fold metallo-hydrolase [Tissierellia bacterium]|nr:MBL fold metallo-hydrolase [Tissierellia bacterium]